MKIKIVLTASLIFLFANLILMAYALDFDNTNFTPNFSGLNIYGDGSFRDSLFVNDIELHPDSNYPEIDIIDKVTFHDAIKGNEGNLNVNSDLTITDGTLKTPTITSSDNESSAEIDDVIYVSNYFKNIPSDRANRIYAARSTQNNTQFIKTAYCDYMDMLLSCGYYIYETNNNGIFYMEQERLYYNFEYCRVSFNRTPDGLIPETYTEAYCLDTY